MKSQKFSHNWYMGYIYSREIDGNLIPQKVQNLVIRDFAQRNNLNYILSSTEYKMKNSFLMFNSLLSKKKRHFDGIIIYSLFMLKDYPNIKNLLVKIKKKKIKIYCALEEIELKKMSQLNFIKEIFYIKKNV